MNKEDFVSLQVDKETREVLRKEKAITGLPIYIMVRDLVNEKYGKKENVNA